MNLNVIYSTDENYVPYAGVSIVSLLENNKDIDKIDIYIIENRVSNSSKNKLEKCVEKYTNARIHFLDFKLVEDRLNLNMAWNISISSYARLFLTSLLSDKIDKILYLDCDVIVNASLRNFWYIDIEKYYFAGIQDTVNENTKLAVDIDKYDTYYNAGVLLINLKKWRNDNVEQKFIDFINKKNGSVIHHDQGVINSVLGNQALKVPLKYNVMTIHYFLNRKKLLEFFSEKAEFYSEQEILEAKSNPVILHFTPSFTTRPWVKNCKHPKKSLYYKYLNNSPWRDLELLNCKDKWYISLINWRYRNIPIIKKGDKNG